MKIEKKKYFHKPVLLKEVVKILDPKPGQVFVDATCGLGGHSQAILKKIGSFGKILCLDADIKALKQCKDSLKRKNNIVFVEGNFRDLKEIVRDKGFDDVDGILYDLGLSSLQLADKSRGFSFRENGLLDMRISNKTFLLASDLINNLKESELVEIFKKYGEEKEAKVIAKEIVKTRAQKKITRANELVDIILRVVPYQYKRKIHPATKVFQALRIAVNQELENLSFSLPQAIDLLKKGGRVVVISYHSLEDRIVKNIFKKEAKGCVCPSELPVCKCGKKPRLVILTSKPIIPKKDEIKTNPRSRSAKLRAAEKI
ncbi:MAG: 16S rRNA (cytosine(1402)-N(4))-methyltransferase RsmH [Candidatus Aenigmarchaeota archaeon]|nr:16S rRNA (cytosine(1402)-N(4))-methyltransferase RsmH [Candidatus Aenigmarchaeota archaeon]